MRQLRMRELLAAQVGVKMAEHSKDDTFEVVSFPAPDGEFHRLMPRSTARIDTVSIRAQLVDFTWGPRAGNVAVEFCDCGGFMAMKRLEYKSIGDMFIDLLSVEGLRRKVSELEGHIARLESERDGLREQIEWRTAERQEAESRIRRLEARLATIASIAAGKSGDDDDNYDDDELDEL